MRKRLEESFLFFLFTIIICLLLFNCNEHIYKIYSNQSFEDICSIAYKNEKAFCIVLVDSTQELSRRYCLNLKNKGFVDTSKAIYNIADVNISSNAWYMKWLCPLSLPLTCVFSDTGTLIDLIPGATKETFLYTTEAISDMKITNYHYPNRFKIPKYNVIHLLNQVLKCKMDLNQGIYIPTALNNSIDSLVYPYSVYLGMVGELMDNDTIETKTLANLMMKLENPYYLELFKNEFITAKKVLNPNFKIDDEPNIRVNSEVVSLSDCAVSEDNVFEYYTYDNLIDKIENGTGVIFLAYPTCKYCDLTASLLDGISKEKEIEEISYYNIKDMIKVNTNIKVLLVGGGPDLDNLKELTKKLNLENYVIFTDKVNYDLVPTYFNIFNVVVSFSKTETQGLTIIEGLAASKPTLCIEDDSFRAMIEPNYNGYLFKNDTEFKDYIFKLMNDQKLYKDMSTNARNSTYKYSKEVFAADILKVYHKAIEKKH